MFKLKNEVLRASIAVAMASACSASFAGAISVPLNDAAATVYATEALTSATAVSIPAVQYTMGVARTDAQDFTMIFTPSAGATFTPANCVGANFTVAGGGGAATISTKRSSAGECAVEVDVTTAFTTATTITATGGADALVLASHPLATAGGSVAVTVALKDLGETAFIDNAGSLTRTVATSVNAINVYAATSDTLTVADVNAATGPLEGFVAGNGDTVTVANAFLTLDNNSVGAMAEDGATPFDFLTTTGTVTIALADANKAFEGLAAGGLCFDINNDNGPADLCDLGEVFAAPVTGTATLATIPAAAFPAQGPVATRAVTFEVDGVTSLGTSRTIAVSGSVTPEVGAAHAFADTATLNANFWVWSANAVELWSPFFTTHPNYLSRFVLMNTGAPVTYSATCLAETGNTVTAGIGATGTLATGQTVIDADTVCTMSGNTRASVRFIINGPAGNIHGTYSATDKVNLIPVISEMTRPFAAGTY